MKSRRIKIIVLLLVAAAITAAAVVFLLPNRFHVDQTRYEKVPVTDPNGMLLQIIAVNRTGQMVAYPSVMPGGVWPIFRIGPDGRSQAIPIPKEYRATPVDINDRGAVVGSVIGQNNSQDAFIWEPQRGFQIIPVRGVFPNADSEAWKINNTGIIVGLWNCKQPPSKGVFYYDPNIGVFDIKPLNGISVTISGLDENGVIVGEYQSPSGHHAFLWSRQEGLVDLHPAITHPANSNAMAINDNGWILIGSSGKNNRGRIVLYHRTFGTTPLCELRREVFDANPVPSSDQFTVMEYRPAVSIRRFRIRPSECNNWILQRDRKPILINPKILSGQNWFIVGIDDQGNIVGDTVGYRDAYVYNPSEGFILRPIRPDKSGK